MRTIMGWTLSAAGFNDYEMANGRATAVQIQGARIKHAFCLALTTLPPLLGYQFLCKGIRVISDLGQFSGPVPQEPRRADGSLWGLVMPGLSTIQVEPKLCWRYNRACTPEELAAMTDRYPKPDGERIFSVKQVVERGDQVVVLSGLFLLAYSGLFLQQRGWRRIIKDIRGLWNPVTIAGERYQSELRQRLKIW